MRIVASGGNTQLGSFTPTAEAGQDGQPRAVRALGRAARRWASRRRSWIDLSNSALATAD
jgi:hypothetical protein